MSAPAKVYVVIYTVYHHVHKLAVEVQKGLESTGVTTKMFQGKLIKKTRGFYLSVLSNSIHSTRNIT